MSPTTRTGLVLLGGCIAVGLLFTLRFQTALGAFETIKPVAPGPCRAIAKGLNGPEDVEIDAAHNAMIISTGGASSRKTPRDGIYWLKLNDPDGTPVKLAGTPPGSHTHGINLYHAPDGSETLFVINHKSNRVQAIETYALTYEGDTPKLTAGPVISDPALIGPNDLAAVSPNSFYVANDRVSTTALGGFAENNLLLPLANVMFYDGKAMRVVASHIAYPNGVLVTPDRRFVYVDAFNERRVIAFRIDPASSDLSEIGALSLPAKLDNISMDGQGNLIAAGRTKPISSQVFRIHLGPDGVPQRFDTLYSEEGHTITRASSGTIYGGHLYIGSSRDDHMLMCDIQS